MLNDKKILLCVSGGIAVYKAAALTSKLVQSGAEVKVMMTESAKQFVSPLTFQALSRNPVYDDTFDEKDPKVIAHIDLADWADLVLIAPATANVLGKLANGIADDMVTTTLLATTAPVWVAPAMNVHMYSHPIVQENMKKLHGIGYQFVEPKEGYLACGYVGKGRLEEPESIVSLLDKHFTDDDKKPLAGKKVLVTAGPTVEKVDPVRFFTNRSTGKMGYAVAEQAEKMGADVILVSGPVNLEPPVGVKVINVESAKDMYEAVMKYFDEVDIVIKSAAVADYRPAETSPEKIKKKDGNWKVSLERTTDILKSLGEQKKHQVLIGFAAESERVEEYAKRKLVSKNLDMIVANDIKEQGAGFGYDTNIVTMVKKDGTIKKLPKLTKSEVAKVIVEEAASLLKEDHHENS